MVTNRIILPVSPETNVLVTQGTAILFQIPEKCYKGENGGGCLDYQETGLCKHTLNKNSRRMKRRLERYNRYKSNLLTAAKQAGFQLPTCGWSIYFYIPIPKYWPNWKRKLFHGQFNLQKPDLTNYIKAFEDSLTITDEQIAQRSGEGKFWVDTKTTEKRGEKLPPGWIEILINQPVYNPFGVTFIDQKTAIKMKDEQRRQEKQKSKPVKKKRVFSKRRRDIDFKKLWGKKKVPA